MPGIDGYEQPSRPPELAPDLLGFSLVIFAQEPGLLKIETQPVEEPENPQHLLDMMEQVGFDRLLFATDYPHWDFDDPARVLPTSLTLEQRKQICSGNARELYRLD